MIEIPTLEYVVYTIIQHIMSIIFPISVNYFVGSNGIISIMDTFEFTVLISYCKFNDMLL